MKRPSFTHYTHVYIGVECSKIESALPEATRISNVASCVLDLQEAQQEHHPDQIHKNLKRKDSTVLNHDKYCHWVRGVRSLLVTIQRAITTQPEMASTKVPTGTRNG